VGCVHRKLSEYEGGGLSMVDLRRLHGRRFRRMRALCLHGHLPGHDEQVTLKQRQTRVLLLLLYWVDFAVVVGVSTLGAAVAACPLCQVEYSRAREGEGKRGKDKGDGVR
jgi:hypothetical protein